MSTEVKSNLRSQILMTGLIAGTMDITAACIQFAIKTGKGPVVILQYIASAVFGKETAYSGALIYPVLGLLFHYIIATGWGLLFFLLYPRLGFLRMNKFAVAVGYGIFVWACMNRVVVPLTKIQTGPFVVSNAIQAAAILIVCIGLPVSLMANRYYRQNKDSN